MLPLSNKKQNKKVWPGAEVFSKRQNKVIFSDTWTRHELYWGSFYVVDLDINAETYIAMLGDHLLPEIPHVYNFLRIATAFFRTTMRLYIRFPQNLSIEVYDLASPKPRLQYY